MSPAQTNQNKAEFYKTGDTAPPLRRCLKDGEGNPIDLTGTTVTISIANAMRQGGFVLFPRDIIVFEDPCVIDPDQTEDGNRGWVGWTPGEAYSGTGFDRSGRFQYAFEVTYPDETHQTIPPNTWLPLVVQPKVGGPLPQSGASSSQSAPQVFPPASP